MSNQYAPPAANVDDVHRGGGGITPAMIEALRGTKGWVMLIGILMFIGAAFSGLGGLFMLAGMGFMGAEKGMPGGVGMLIGMGVFYLIFSVIYIFLGKYLVQYSSASSRLVRDGHAADMESALDSQRKFWRMAGVMALLTIVFMVLGMVAAIAIPVIMGISGGS